MKSFNLKIKKIGEFWYKLPQNFRFLIIGSCNAVISYFIYSIFCIILGYAFYQAALIIGWGISSFISFNAQKYLVFQSSGNWFKEYLKCSFTWVLSYLLNALLLEVCVKFLLLNVFISQILSTLIAAIFTFVFFKKFAFKSR